MQANNDNRISKEFEDILRRQMDKSFTALTIDMSKLKGMSKADAIQTILNALSGKNISNSDMAHILKYMSDDTDAVIQEAIAKTTYIDEIMELSIKLDMTPYDLIESIGGYMYGTYCSHEKLTVEGSSKLLSNALEASAKVRDYLNRSPYFNNVDEKLIALLTTAKDVIQEDQRHKCPHASASKIKNRDKTDKINGLLKDLLATLNS